MKSLIVPAVVFVALALLTLQATHQLPNWKLSRQKIQGKYVGSMELYTGRQLKNYDYAVTIHKISRDKKELSAENSVRLTVKKRGLHVGLHHYGSRASPAVRL